MSKFDRELTRLETAILAEIMGGTRITNTKIVGNIKTKYPDPSIFKNAVSGTKIGQVRRNLEKAGLIEYRAMPPCDPKISRIDILKVTLRESLQKDLDLFNAAIKEVSNVIRVDQMAGEVDYLVRVVSHDIKHLMVIRDDVKKIPVVRDVHLWIVTDTFVVDNVKPCDFLKCATDGEN